jgi:hypothetical protein
VRISKGIHGGRCLLKWLVKSGSLCTTFLTCPVAHESLRYLSQEKAVHKLFETTVQAGGLELLLALERRRHSMLVDFIEKEKERNVGGDDDDDE